MKVDLEILEKYIDGRMSHEDKTDFERKLKEEPGLLEELKNYLLSKSAISLASSERLKKQLDAIGAAMGERHPYRTRALTYLLAAAGIALLIGMGWLMMRYFKPQKTSGEIFLSYYQRPDIDEMSFRSTAGDSAIMIWHKAIHHYTVGETQQALEEIGHLTDIPDVTFSSRNYFFQGICYLESNQAEAAIQAFDKVGKGSTYSYKAQFYKALCLIKLNKQEDAAVLLDVIKHDQNHPHRKEAAKLLKELAGLSR